MARFKLHIEYEGTRYSGWQVQKNARTVQGELLAALRTVLGTNEVDVQGAGRTDAGVHALHQVAHLEAQTMLAPEIIRMKVNDLLPADVNLLEVEKAHERFHARHDATARRYLYRISRRRTAFGKRYVWWVKDALDVTRMQSALPHFTGMKDWRAFSDADPEETSTRALIDSVSVTEDGELILIRIAGSHFLWKLVRRIVGILVEVGRGKLAPEEIPGLFKDTTGVVAHHTAPPSGLFLEDVEYGTDKAPGTVRKPPFLEERRGGRRPQRRVHHGR
ncbi:MAG TPA: tRNA pseudouridine(38-40) synthase TruA [Bacteroidota bacterium]